MKRYSADSCSVQYFQPYQQYYVPQCLPEYDNWGDLEQNTSDWQMCNNNDNHGVARTSAFSSKFAVAYGTMQNAARQRLSLPRVGTTSPAW